MAVAKAEAPAPKLFEAIAEQASPRLKKFNAHALANSAWVVAKAKAPSPKLFEAIAKQASPRLNYFKPQELANTA